MEKIRVPARVPARVIEEVRETAAALDMKLTRAVEVALINFVDQYKPRQPKEKKSA